jgi:hypothetical protein
MMGAIWSILLAIITVIVAWLVKQHYSVSENIKRQGRLDSLEDRLDQFRDQEKDPWILDGMARPIEVVPKQESKIVVQMKTHQSCPLCREAIDSCIYYCNDCKTLYHIDCIEEMTKGICPTTGCHNNILAALCTPEDANQIPPNRIRA